MNTFEIVTYPDKRLSTICQPVTEIDDNLKNILNEMLIIMKNNSGIGLAAPQIGILKRFLVIEIDNEPLKIINPVIINTSNEKITYEEGCLSLPHLYEKVKRFRAINIRYTNESGIIVERQATGLLSICIQHEIDHLDGKMFIDRLSPLQKELAVRKYIKTTKKMDN